MLAALDLLPGLRDRLSLRRNRVGMPQHGQLTYVAALTYRAIRTVSRWFEPERPGPPDVESLARLCDSLGCNSDWMLGLTPGMVGSPALVRASDAELQWVGEMLARLRRTHSDCEQKLVVVRRNSARDPRRGHGVRRSKLMSWGLTSMSNRIDGEPDFQARRDVLGHSGKSSIK